VDDAAMLVGIEVAETRRLLRNQPEDGPTRSGRRSPRARLSAVATETDAGRSSTHPDVRGRQSRCLLLGWLERPANSSGTKGLERFSDSLQSRFPGAVFTLMSGRSARRLSDAEPHISRGGMTRRHAGSAGRSAGSSTWCRAIAGLQTQRYRGMSSDACAAPASSTGEVSP
jgi:hypothetical protein